MVVTNFQHVWDLYKAGSKKFKPLKISMERNDGGFEDDFPFQTGDF